MATLPRSILLQILTFILTPVVKFCVRHSLHLQDLVDCAKLVFVQVAEASLNLEGHRKNVSRISLMTGVHRPDVTRLLKDGDGLRRERDLIRKILGQWQGKKNFLTSSGKPRVLSFQGSNSEFSKLVASVSKDINTGTVLFELERIGAIRRTAKGLKLIAESYVPKEDPLAGFSILSDDMDSFIRAVETNVLTNPMLPEFHARTEYDNVRPDSVLALKKWFLQEGHKFHSRVREIVSSHDQDINPDLNFHTRGVKVVFTSFSSISEEES